MFHTSRSEQHTLSCGHYLMPGCMLLCCCRVGVSSEPDCITVELTPQDKFIVLASDGVWEFISNKEAVDMIAKCDTAEEGCRQV